MVVPTCLANPRLRRDEWDVLSASPSRGDRDLGETIAVTTGALLRESVFVLAKSLRSRP